MTTFYIYEVIGHKNGATKDWDTRSQYNFETYGIMPILIETMEGPDTPEFWQIVGDREWELAEQNGYPKGEHYRSAREKRILAGRIGGMVRPAHLNATFESRSKGGRNSKANKLTVEQELEVVNKYIPRLYSQYKLAEEYGVVQSCINAILKRHKKSL